MHPQASLRSRILFFWSMLERMSISLSGKELVVHDASELISFMACSMSPADLLMEPRPGTQGFNSSF